MRRVVVTGIGIVSPIGIGVENVWKNLISGRSGIGRITKFDPSPLATQIAGEVKDFNPEQFIEKKEIKKMDTFIHFAVAAAKIAVEDSGLDMNAVKPERVGVVVGAGLGGLPGIEKYHKILLEEGPKRISPFFIPMVIANLAAGQISIMLGAKGPNSSTSTACAAGAHAIGDSAKYIQLGYADVMIAGGAESTITPLAIAGFNSMKALSTRNNEPERASRPFDKDRDGFVMGEGAGIIILEELEHARKRGARIYAEFAGYGLNADAYHITAPDPEGEGGRRCMEMALEDARIDPSEVDYINAHGTSTYYNDILETKAIKRLFGEHAKKLMVSSTKSMTGHLLGAAGGVEAAFTVLSIYHGVIPPTINLENPDPECDLDYVPNQAREKRIRVAISNSFGFGGTNACLVFKRFEL